MAQKYVGKHFTREIECKILPVLEYCRSLTVHVYSRSCGRQPLSWNSYVGGAMYFFCAISCNFPTTFSAELVCSDDADTNVRLNATSQTIIILQTRSLAVEDRLHST